MRVSIDPGCHPRNHNESPCGEGFAEAVGPTPSVVGGFAGSDNCHGGSCPLQFAGFDGSSIVQYRWRIGNFFEQAGVIGVCEGPEVRVFLLVAIVELLGVEARSLGNQGFHLAIAQSFHLSQL